MKLRVQQTGMGRGSRIEAGFNGEGRVTGAVDASGGRRFVLAIIAWGFVGLLGVSSGVVAQDEDDETDAAEEVLDEEVAAPEKPPAPPVQAPPASPFKFTINGTVAATLFAQDKPWATGNGLSTLFGPLDLPDDGWLLGGDIRQTRISFSGEGPPVLGLFKPKAVLEVELMGGNQVLTIPAAPSPVPVYGADGSQIGTGVTPGFVSSAQGDESLLPRVRTAYIELAFNEGQDLLRIGQYHHLLLAMISASGAHPALMGYGAGQLGWRAPGITYSHNFKLSDSISLNAALQLGRNNWADNVLACRPGTAPPQTNCLPAGVSLAEASMLPSVQARLMLMGPPAESPWLFYAPNQWQIYVVGHWDRKDLSGVGSQAFAPFRDEMDTSIVEGGFKVKLGPLMLASNGWYGVNAGGVFGHILQVQTPDKPDVSGFGVWSQAAFSFSRNFSLWAFAGIDQPNEQEALAAGFDRLQNIQLGAMFAITDGTFATTFEMFFAETITGEYQGGVDGVSPPVLVKTASSGIQPSITVSYTF